MPFEEAALLQIQSILLNFKTPNSSMDSISSNLVRSAWKLYAVFGNLALISSATFSDDCLLRSTTITFDPFDARFLAMPSPIP